MIRTVADRGRIALGAVVAIIAVCWSSVAFAQGAAAQETTIHGGTLVMVAYVTLWVIFGGVLLAVLYRQKVLQRELDELDSRMDALLGAVEEE